MRASSTSIIVAAAMCITAVAAVAARPSTKAGQVSSTVQLETMVPRSFGDWREVRESNVQVVNPQTKEILDKLYSQVLSRTYVNADGYRIMLSMAYGDDQRGGLAAHRPEICYPAQGFQVRNTQDGTLVTSHGSVDVRRLDASLGPRHEPVTYWLTVGDQVIKNQFDKRIAEIRLGLTGQIPDGLLFRVSSIDPDSGRAYRLQQDFAAQMLAAVPAETRRQLSGLGTPPSPAS